MNVGGSCQIKIDESGKLIILLWRKIFACFGVAVQMKVERGCFCSPVCFFGLISEQNYYSWPLGSWALGADHKPRIEADKHFISILR